MINRVLASLLLASSVLCGSLLARGEVTPANAKVAGAGTEWSSDGRSDYQHYIYAQFPSAVESPPPPGFDEHKPIKWIKRIGPNPISRTGTLRIRAIVPSSRSVRLSVYSTSGRQVASQGYTGLPEGETDFTLNLPDLASGVYLVHYEDGVYHRLEDSAKIIVLN